MTTKMPNPHYLPEVCIKVTIINFTVTMEGLEQQLLGLVVKAERPDIEQKKVQLLLQMAEDKRQLQQLEVINSISVLNPSDDHLSSNEYIGQDIADAFRVRRKYFGRRSVD